MNFDELLSKIKSELDTNKQPDKIKVTLLYACNTSGKTRLSKLFSEKYPDNVLCYNAFVEDFFHWDNENLILKINKMSWLAKLINDEGLDGEIIDNFKKLTNSKIEPIFDIANESITFGNHTGDEEASDNIKVSRGEESLFIWSIFHTILSSAISTLKEQPQDRSTDFFNDIKYIIIDDPVSSMDDTRIITIALELIELINQMGFLDNKLKILITTHHSLFLMYCIVKRLLYGEKRVLYCPKQMLMDYVWMDKHQIPLAYHNLIFNEIYNAIQRNDIQKYHFNLFRALLEKTANFLGYSDYWSALLDESENKKIFVKQLNLYSHSSLSEIETSKLTSEDTEAFRATFKGFVEKFHWSCKNETN